jgi:hypothetical protein
MSSSGIFPSSGGSACNPIPPLQHQNLFHYSRWTLLEAPTITLEWIPWDCWELWYHKASHKIYLNNIPKNQVSVPNNASIHFKCRIVLKLDLHCNQPCITQSAYDQFLLWQISSLRCRQMLALTESTHEYCETHETE